MTSNQIKYMVDRFLCWKLPENFSPDAGISFKADFNEGTAWPMKHIPHGTNLLDATQAEAMVRHLVNGLPAETRPMEPTKVEYIDLREFLHNHEYELMEEDHNVEVFFRVRRRITAEPRPNEAELTGTFACRVCGRTSPHGEDAHEAAKQCCP